MILRRSVWPRRPAVAGVQPVFCDAAIQTCLTLRALLGLPLRQVTGMVASLLVLVGFDWPVPDYSTLSRRQKGLLVAISYRSASGALHLLIDSTGIKAEGDGEWCAKKHGPSKSRQWCKVHLRIDAETLKIRAIEITGAGGGDARMLPGLLDQIPADQPIAKVSADGAYDTRACHAAIAGRGAIAVIQTRRTGSPWKEDTRAANARNDILRSTPRCARFQSRDQIVQGRPRDKQCQTAFVNAKVRDGTPRLGRTRSGRHRT